MLDQVREVRVEGLPSGTVTLLFTDVEGSTALVRRLGDDVFVSLLAAHHRIMRAAIGAAGGREVSTEGDAFFVVFERPLDAVAAVLAAQRAFASYPWPESGPVRVRMGLHTGLARVVGETYLGLAVHEAARIAGAAHGGQVLASQATVTAAGTPDPSAEWQSLGRHRLKDLGAPLELFQLCHPDLISDLPAPRSLERVQHNLPVQVSSFIGREDALARGRARLAATRLLSLVGPGGAGKTRLALQLAADVSADFPGGVWVAELAPLTDPAQVPATLMTPLGLRDEPGQTPTEVLVGALAQQRALIVLDNCEHLIDAAAALAHAVLTGCPSVSIVSTSQEPLRVSGETVWALEPLAVPAAGLPLELIASSDAVRLFCERATDADASFSLDEGNADAIAQICAQLEGIPLGIELAAARARTLTPTDMTVLLAESLDILSKGRRGAPHRHASLRGALAWSHDLLSPSEQVLFRRLAVFAGSATLGAIESVAGYPDLRGLPRTEVLDGLDGLVDKSLVTLPRPTDEDPDDGHSVKERRYRLLEPTRLFAAERLEEAGETGAVRRAHAQWCLSLAGAESQPGRRGSIEASRRLTNERANLLAALHHLASGGDPVAHGRLLVDLGWFWRLRSETHLRRDQLTAYLARPDRDPRLAAMAVSGLGNVAFRLGDNALSQTLHQQALTIARELGDRRIEATALNGLATAATQSGNFELGRALHEEAIAIAVEVDEPEILGLSLAGLGWMSWTVGEYSLAQSIWDRALAVARTVHDHGLETDVLISLGDVARALDDHRLAQVHLEDALTLARNLRDRRLEGYSLGSLAVVAQTLGDGPLARRRYQAALEIARDLERGDPDLLVGAALYVADERPTAAAELLGAADALQTWKRAVLDEERYEAAAKLTRQALGAEDSATAAQRGATLDWSAAATLALAALAALAALPAATD